MFQLQSRFVLIIGWLLVVAILALSVWLIQKKPNAPIVLDESSLSPAQKNDIHHLIEQVGKLPFYATNPQIIATQVQGLSWVDAVKVERDYKHGFVIFVVPKTAVANFGTEHLLDISGTPFVPADKSELNNKAFVDIYGERNRTKDIMQKIHKLNNWFLPLGMSVEDMILTPRHTWLVRFNNGLRVTVDYNHVDEKLFQLSAILKQENLPIPLVDIASIDLRYKNGFSITKKYQAQTINHFSR